MEGSTKYAAPASCYADDPLKVVAAVHGVRAVEHGLKVHERADAVPGLQGGGARSDECPEMLQEHWAPTPSLNQGSPGWLSVHGACPPLCGGSGQVV
jgi:hypothetical protein